MVLRTTDEAHPGVQYLQSITPVYLGGKIRLIDALPRRDFAQLSARAERDSGALCGEGLERGSPPSRPAIRSTGPTSTLQKCALELADGLLIHPLVGETKADDTPAEVRMRCYEVLIENYYPKDRVVLSVFPAAMRYAGPREAIFHALVRKNYGCTHFIVGRDHAGVGNYYGTYDAQTIFQRVRPRRDRDHAALLRSRLLLPPLRQHGQPPRPARTARRITSILSGTKVREMLAAGELPPAEFTRAEVAEILVDSVRRGMAA